MEQYRPICLSFALTVLAICSAVLVGDGIRSITAAEKRAQDGNVAVSGILWPGAFLKSSEDASTHVLFEASGRRYVAETRSDGFLVRHGTRDEHAIDVRFVAAQPGVSAESNEAIPGIINVFRGSEVGTHSRHFNRFSSVTFNEIYPGIAARYRVTNGDLELDFLLAAGADPRAIKLVGAAATRFSIDVPTGDIIVSRAAEVFRLQRPRAFQSGPSGLVEVEVRAVASSDSLHFEVPFYDHELPLIIDPLVASWSTFLGTRSDAMYDNAAAVATDSDGNLYVAGLTQFEAIEPGTPFPTTAQSLNLVYPRSPGDGCAYQCGYVLKLTPTHQVVYGALIYGLTIKALAVDGTGNAYITGSTLTGETFPGTAGVFANNPVGQAFVTKIAPDGGSLVYSALFPGDVGKSIAVDAPGNAYVVGQVSVPSLPTTTGSIKPTNPNGATINQDGFLLKVNPSGSTLIYGTYLGGSGADVANTVQVNAQGEAVVAGATASNDFVGFNRIVAGSQDAYLVKVASDGSQILSGQMLGGTADDIANGIAADGAGGWIACGVTTSSDFPVVGAFQSHLLGERNGWLRRVDANFTPVYSTYFGGLALDGCLNVASDAQGNAYLVGVSFSADLPITSGAFQDTTSSIVTDSYAGLSDTFYVWGRSPTREAYFAKFSDTGALLYGTYLGGYETWPRHYDALTIGTGVSVGASGRVAVSGATTAASFPVTDNGLRAEMGGTADGFIVTFEDSPVAVVTPSLLPAAPLQMPYQVTLQASGGTPPYSWTKVGFELPNGITLSTSGVLAGAVTNPQTESNGYQFTVKVTDAAGRTAYKSLFLNIGWPGNFTCEVDTCVAVLLRNNQLVYRVPPLARGAYPQYFRVTGQVPPGIAVSDTGEITGAPTEVGEYRFGFQITDASGQKSSSFNFHVMVVSGPGVASATLTASPATPAIGQAITLSWSSFYTTGCIASGGGANGAAWSGNLPVFGSITQTATTVGNFDYAISCPSGGSTPIVARASVSVAANSSGNGGSSGGNGAGSGGGGGGSVFAFEIAALALLAVFRRLFGLNQCCTWQSATFTNSATTTTTNQPMTNGAVMINGACNQWCRLEVSAITGQE